MKANNFKKWYVAKKRIIRNS